MTATRSTPPTGSSSSSSGPRNRIRVSSLYPESRSRGRRLRSIAVRRGGRWRDVGRILVTEGQALWWPGQAEDAANERYSVLAQRAAAAHKGSSRPTHCGIGPNEGHPIGLWAQWDADGNDRQDVNGEWVRIRNYDPINPLPLDGWYLRDSGLRRFTFPAGSAIPPTARSRSTRAKASTSGPSSSGASTRRCSRTPRDDRGMGDGAYLFDPQGDIRAWMIYPCRISCANPAQGQISLGSAAEEGRVHLGHQHRRGADRPRDLRAQDARPTPTRSPGDDARPRPDDPRPHPGRPAEDTADDKYWGMTGQILNNSGDKATFGTYTD